MGSTGAHKVAEKPRCFLCFSPSAGQNGCDVALICCAAMDSQLASYQHEQLGRFHLTVPPFGKHPAVPMAIPRSQERTESGLVQSLAALARQPALPGLARPEQRIRLGGPLRPGPPLGASKSSAPTRADLTKSLGKCCSTVVIALPAWGVVFAFVWSALIRFGYLLARV